MYEILGMVKTLSGDVVGDFTELSVQQDGLISNDLTVLGTLTASSLTFPSISTDHYTATGPVNQFRADSGTVDIKSTTDSNPVVRLRNNANVVTGTTLQTGIVQGVAASTTETFSTQTNSSSGASGGSGMKAINDTGSALSIGVKSSNHSSKPNISELKSTSATALHVVTDGGANVKIRVNDTDQVTVSTVSTTVSNTLVPSGGLNVTGSATINSGLTIAAGGLTVSGGTTTLNTATASTSTISATGKIFAQNNEDALSSSTGGLQCSGGISATKQVFAGGGILLPYSQTISTPPLYTYNKILDNQWSAAGLPQDSTCLYTPGTSATADSSFVFGAQKGKCLVPGTTVSSSTTTGALVVNGGVGIAGNLNVGGTITGGTVVYGTASSGTFDVTTTPGTGTFQVRSVTDATSRAAAASIFHGGVACNKTIWCKDIIADGTITGGSVVYSSTASGTFSVTNPSGVTFTVASTLDSANAFYASATFAGGVGIGKNLVVNSSVYSQNHYFMPTTNNDFCGGLFYRDPVRATIPFYLGASPNGNVDTIGVGYNDGSTPIWLATLKGQLKVKELTWTYREVTTGGTTTLLATDGNLIIVTGTAVVLKLPAATSYQFTGTEITIVNRSNDRVYIQDNAGTGLFEMETYFGTVAAYAESMLKVVCTSVATAAGSWVQITNTSKLARNNVSAADQFSQTTPATFALNTANNGGTLLVQGNFAPNLTNNQQAAILVGADTTNSLRVGYTRNTGTDSEVIIQDNKNTSNRISLKNGGMQIGFDSYFRYRDGTYNFPTCGAETSPVSITYPGTRVLHYVIIGRSMMINFVFDVVQFTISTPGTPAGDIYIETPYGLTASGTQYQNCAALQYVNGNVMGTFPYGGIADNVTGRWAFVNGTNKIKLITVQGGYYGPRQCSFGTQQYYLADSIQFIVD